jgi:hypothetical protein
MLHFHFSKLKNPAGGWVFLECIDRSDLHGNPARIDCPGSAQVAETDRCCVSRHEEESTE